LRLCLFSRKFKGSTSAACPDTNLLCSLLVLHAENGPYSLAHNMTLLDNPFGWDKHASVIYVDQPINTGYSYSKVCDSKRQPVVSVVLFRIHSTQLAPPNEHQLAVWKYRTRRRPVIVLPAHQASAQALLRHTPWLTLSLFPCTAALLLAVLLLCAPAGSS
jgi:hypothetical protein